MRALLVALSLACCAPASSQDAYGTKGIYPVYESAGQWLIFDKSPSSGKRSPLTRGSRFLVVGSKGSELFTVARNSVSLGGACEKNKPIQLRTALLKGPRKVVGTPIIGIRVKKSFTLDGSRAKYMNLRNEITEAAYSRLGDAIKAADAADVRSGSFRFSLDDNPGPIVGKDPRPEHIQLKMDFGARLSVSGMKDGFVFIEGSQISATFRRCLRLADGKDLVGDCVAMPDKLMAETASLNFVAYDPGGDGKPLLLAYTPQTPMWGDERWGFALRSTGPKLVLFDAMDPRCREGF